MGQVLTATCWLGPGTPRPAGPVTVGFSGRRARITGAAPGGHVAYCWSGVPTPPVHGPPYSGVYFWEARNLFTNCCSRGSVGEDRRSWNPHELATIGDGSPGNGVRSIYREPPAPAVDRTVCPATKER